MRKKKRISKSPDTEHEVSSTTSTPDTNSTSTEQYIVSLNDSLTKGRKKRKTRSKRSKQSDVIGTPKGNDTADGNKSLFDGEILFINGPQPSELPYGKKTFSWSSSRSPEHHHRLQKKTEILKLLSPEKLKDEKKFDKIPYFADIKREEERLERKDKLPIKVKKEENSRESKYNINRRDSPKTFRRSRSKFKRNYRRSRSKSNEIHRRSRSKCRRFYRRSRSKTKDTYTLSRSKSRENYNYRRNRTRSRENSRRRSLSKSRDTYKRRRRSRSRERSRHRERRRHRSTDRHRRSRSRSYRRYRSRTRSRSKDKYRMENPPYMPQMFPMMFATPAGESTHHFNSQNWMPNMFPTTSTVQPRFPYSIPPIITPFPPMAPTVQNNRFSRPMRKRNPNHKHPIIVRLPKSPMFKPSNRGKFYRSRKP